MKTGLLSGSRTRALLLALLCGAGMALGMLGLVIVVPLIGHASWHAYRDLVVPEAGPR